MVQFVKVISIAFVFGVSLLPAKNQAQVHQSTQQSGGLAIAISDLGAPPGRGAAVPLVRLDELSVKAVDAMIAKADAEAAAQAAAEAKAKAEAEAQAKIEADALAASQAAKVAAAAKVSAPVAKPAAASGPAPSGSVPDMIRTAFGPQGPGAVDWGLRIAKCESGYNPNAYNSSGASGVFQFMPSTFRGTPYGGGNIFDAWTNVQAAAWYYGRYGGGAWVCS